MEFQDILNQIVESINRHPNHCAFCIRDVKTSYSEFGLAISGIRKQLQEQKSTEKKVGVVLNDDFRTYAALVALWFEGKAYVPINPELPAERNNSIIKQAEIKVLLNSGTTMLGVLDSALELIEINTAESEVEVLNLTIVPVADKELAYILFTSGSTGIPKGVPISRTNVAKFMEGVSDMKMEFSQEDKFLQMFDLTFDLSVWSFLQPLCLGATQFPIPHGEIKYMYAYELIEEQEITVALMVPSILNFLRPYFEDLNFPKMRYSLFCGEALYGDVVKEWTSIVPNAKVFNVYGPTEATIFCSQYEIPRNQEIACSNGIVNIGIPLTHTDLIIVDELLQPTKIGERGELCIGGLQVTSGYLNNEVLNQTAFFDFNNQRYYHSGDICFVDEAGHLMYSGRLDSQIKIQGFRIELSEIEFQARAVSDPYSVAAVAIADDNGIFEIHLFINNPQVNVHEITTLLKQKLPVYMVPKQIHGIETFPLNVNGKIDRKQLKASLIQKITIRKATANDLEFLVEAVINAEKSGTERLSYSTIFKISELEVRNLLCAMIAENEGYCELSIDSFLIAEVNGEKAGTVASWVEGEDDVPSAIVKANLLFSFMPPDALSNLRDVASLLDEVHIPRIIGALQLESIYTVSSFRGMGIVKRLIEKHIEFAKENHPGIDTAQIILSDVNESALKAYKKSDFELTLHKKSKNPLLGEILPSMGNYCMIKQLSL
jgi:amino acid adenylation domain-containing protein